MTQGEERTRKHGPQTPRQPTQPRRHHGTQPQAARRSTPRQKQQQRSAGDLREVSRMRRRPSEAHALQERHHAGLRQPAHLQGHQTRNRTQSRITPTSCAPHDSGQPGAWWLQVAPAPPAHLGAHTSTTKATRQTATKPAMQQRKEGGVMGFSSLVQPPAMYGRCFLCCLSHLLGGMYSALECFVRHHCSTNGGHDLIHRYSDV